MRTLSVILLSASLLAGSYSRAEEPRYTYSVTIQNLQLPGMTEQECLNAIQEGLHEWERHCEIRFKSGADNWMFVHFMSVPNHQMRHNPAEGGRRSSYCDRIPTLNARIAFNRGQSWNHRRLVAAVVHELGHFTGREHSDDPTSVMHQKASATKLNADDIQRAQKIYGKP